MGAAVKQAVNESVVITAEEWMARELKNLVRAAYDESADMRVLEYDENRVDEMLGYAVHAPEKLYGGVCVELGRDRRIHGFLIGGPTGVPYATEGLGVELLAYVSPAQRGADVYERLGAAFARWAKRAHLKAVVLEHSALVCANGRRTVRLA